MGQSGSAEWHRGAGIFRLRSSRTGKQSNQAVGGQDALVLKPVLIEEPAVEATAELDGSGLQVGVISTRDHGEVVDALATVCCSELLLKGVETHNLHMAQVALPTELPYATKQLISVAPVPLDAVVVI